MRILSSHTPETKLLASYRSQDKATSWWDVLSEFWNNLTLNKQMVVKRTASLSKRSNIGKIQTMLLKEFPHLSASLQREAAKTHLLYYVNKKQECKNLPELVKAAKKELITHFPKVGMSFDERFILKELKARVDEVKAEAVQKEIAAFFSAEKGSIKNTKALKYIQNEISTSSLAKLVRKEKTLLTTLDPVLSPYCKLRLKRELERKPPVMKGEIIKKGAKIPSSDLTVEQEALSYPVQSATEHQAKIDYGRSPRIFIDGELYCYPDPEKLFPKIEKKYGRLAAILITQGKFAAMEKFLTQKLNPKFFEVKEMDLGAYRIMNQHLMTYSIEKKGKMVEFTYKICKEVLDSDKIEEGPMFYAPLEQTILIPSSELKEGNIKTAKTTIHIHDSVSTLSEAHKVLNIPRLTPRDASKFVKDCETRPLKSHDQFSEVVASLLVNDEKFETNIEGFLKKVEKKSVSIYQTLLKKVEEVLVKQSSLA